MDHRSPLKPNTVLPFAGMYCHVETVVGCGSNAIVYKGWYADRLNPDQKHHVLIKELFPFHPQRKIWREDENGIHVDEAVLDVWQMHKSSFKAGNGIHLRLLEEHPGRIGANLNSFSLNGTLYSVLGYSGGRSLQEELTVTGKSLRQIAKRMLYLLDALEAFHKSGYLHLDISPDNIMLVGSGDAERIFLIDYNSARPLDSEEAVYSSFKAGYSAPEVEVNNTAALGFASDLYSVAAVFYRCIMGRALTLEEMLRSKAPDGKGSPYLSEMPQTVTAMVGQILRKGLHTLPGKRYQTTGQMRQAFEELIDRIDCVGVTHWALWENGKRSVEELIKINPSLRYVTDEKTLYPIRLRQEGSLTLEAYLRGILSPVGSSGLILAQGGMGKTTLLLHTALMQGRRYSPAAPAVFYISLNGWNPGDTRYIQNQILLRLRFKRETNRYDSALHELQQLLRKPLKTRNGHMPVVLLLLDGLNEVRGNTGPLVQEINELSAMAGVRILAASRSEMPALTLETASLAPLEREDIEKALGKKGLLIPENSQVMALLKTPLILSIYIQASEDGKQLDIHSEEELMQAYMDALFRKEIQNLPENAPERWQLDAALNFVLPSIAAEESRTGTGLSEEHLLKTVETCWRMLHSRRMQKLFPQWIGHSKDILGEAGTSEEWYGLIIHRLLWQRLGLLMKDPSGGYRIFHQIMKEYLAEIYRKQFPKPQKLRWAALGAVSVVAAAALFMGMEHRAAVDADIQKAIDYSAAGYVSFGTQYEQLRELTDNALEGNEEAFYAGYEQAAKKLSEQTALTATEALYRTYIENNVLDEEKTASWSGQSFDGVLALELVDYAAQRSEYYADMLPVMASWMLSQQNQEDCPELITAFSQVLEADADVAGELYHQVCAVHLEGGDEVWRQGVRELVAGIPQQEAHRVLTSMENRDQYLENLRSQLSQAEQELARAKAAVELNTLVYIQQMQQELAEVKEAVEVFCPEEVLLKIESAEEYAADRETFYSLLVNAGEMG